MTYLPHRYTDKSVRRFVPLLETLITNHRTFGDYPVQFDPNQLGISVETGMARLRDAVHSIVNGLTTYSNVRASELATIWSRYKVISDGVNILVQPKQVTANQTQVFVTTKLATLTVSHPNFPQLCTAFAVLLGNRILQGEVTINGDLPPALSQDLERDYDIVISQTGPNQYTML